MNQTREDVQTENSELIQAFSEHMAKTEFSISTRKGYCRDLETLNQFLTEKVQTLEPGAKGNSIPFTKLSAGIILEHRGWLGDAEYAPSTVHRNFAAIKAMCAYLQAIGKIGTDPTMGITYPNKPRKAAPGVVSSEEIERLFAQTAGNAFRHRDRVILRLVILCGVKISELEGLRRSDLTENTDEMRLELRLKNPSGRSRLVPLPEEVAKDMESYLASQLDSRPEAPLFINKHGNKISCRSLRRRISGHIKKAGLSLSLTTMELRYHYIRQLVAKRKTRREIRTLVGSVNDVMLGELEAELRSSQ